MTRSQSDATRLWAAYGQDQSYAAGSVVIFTSEVEARRYAMERYLTVAPVVFGKRIDGRDEALRTRLDALDSGEAKR